MSAKRTVIAVVAIIISEACTHWTAVELQPGAGNTGQVRVILTSGAELLVQAPYLSGDSLVWLSSTRADGSRVAPGDSLIRQGVPISQVAKIEARRIDPVATSLAVLGGIALVAAVASSGNSGKGSSGGSSCSSCDTLSSCPLVYSWDGKHWHLDSGTFGGAVMRALARTDVDNLAHIATSDGRLRLKVANELNETDYVDAVSVLAVDHDSDVTVSPDGFGRLYSLGTLTHPLSAHDFQGADVLPYISAADGLSWQSRFVERDTARVETVRDGLELSFLRPHGAKSARLVLDGHNTPWAAIMLGDFIAAHGTETRAWYDSLDAAPERARALGQALAREGFLSVAVRQEGDWRAQGLVWEAGPEIEKRQVLPLDVSEVTGDTVHIRLESAPSFWLIDQVALDFSSPRSLAVTELWAARATFDSQHDVRSALAAPDGQVLTLERGDSAILDFVTPPVPVGRLRSYLLRTTGWYHIHSPEVGPPAVALLRRMQSEPYAASRYSVARLNQALDALRSNAHRTAAP